MAKFYTSVASSTNAVDWHNLFAAGGVLAGQDVSSVVIRTGTNTRVAAGAADPGTSGSAGVAVTAGTPLNVIFDNRVTSASPAVANGRNIWVMTPASASAGTEGARISIEVDVVSDGNTFIVQA